MGDSETPRSTMERNEEKSMENSNYNYDKYVTRDHDPKIHYRGWKVMPFIIGNETFEKLGAIGTLANLLVYLTTVFNLNNVTATNMVNIFNGSTNFATLLGAFFSDTYFGRYKTLGFCTITSFLGLLLIQLTAAFKNLHPPHCEKNSTTCKGPTPGQMAFLLTGFGLLLVGAAGVRPCNLAFGADQFNPNTESGKKGINSFFNWYFFTFNFAMMVSLTLIVYVQSNVSWAIGLGIPLWFSAIFFSLVMVQQTTFLVFQALQSDRRLGHSNFEMPGASYNVFVLLTMTFWLPIYDRIVVPFLRRLTGKEAGITILQRMGIGIFLAILSMLLSAFVEEHRRKLAITNPIGILPRKGAISSMSALWLIPQLVLAGLADSFTAVGQVELFYKQFPENMRSIGGSLFFCGMAGSSYLSTFLISVVHRTTEKSDTGNWLPEDLNKGRLDLFYCLIASIQALNLVYFLFCSKWYKYKETAIRESEASTNDGV